MMSTVADVGRHFRDQVVDASASPAKRRERPETAELAQLAAQLADLFLQLLRAPGLASIAFSRAGSTGFTSSRSRRAQRVDGAVDPGVAGDRARTRVASRRSISPMKFDAAPVGQVQVRKRRRRGSPGTSARAHRARTEAGATVKPRPRATSLIQPTTSASSSTTSRCGMFIFARRLPNVVGNSCSKNFRFPGPPRRGCVSWFSFDAHQREIPVFPPRSPLRFEVSATTQGVARSMPRANGA